MVSYELVIYVQIFVIIILAMIIFRSPQHGLRQNTTFYYGTATPIANVTRYSQSFPYE